MSAPRFTKEQRDKIALMSIALVRHFGERDTRLMLEESLSVSRDTAQHIIRRGIFLSVNQGTK